MGGSASRARRSRSRRRSLPAASARSNPRGSSRSSTGWRPTRRPTVRSSPTRKAVHSGPPRTRSISTGSTTAPLDVSRDYLCTLPGVARKTAACVLLFAYGLPDIPVDTHVGRVGTRLGLFRAEGRHSRRCTTRSSNAGRRPSWPTKQHVNLIRHGRRVCHARAPQCDICPLAEVCPSDRALSVEVEGRQNDFERATSFSPCSLVAVCTSRRPASARRATRHLDPTHRPAHQHRRGRRRPHRRWNAARAFPAESTGLLLRQPHRFRLTPTRSVARTRSSLTLPRSIRGWISSRVPAVYAHFSVGSSTALRAAVRPDGDRDFRGWRLLGRAADRRVERFTEW